MNGGEGGHLNGEAEEEDDRDDLNGEVREALEQTYTKWQIMRMNLVFFVQLITISQTMTV